MSTVTLAADRRRLHECSQRGQVRVGRTFAWKPSAASSAAAVADVRNAEGSLKCQRCAVTAFMSSVPRPAPAVGTNPTPPGSGRVPTRRRLPGQSARVRDVSRSRRPMMSARRASCSSFHAASSRVHRKRSGCLVACRTSSPSGRPRQVLAHVLDDQDDDVCHRLPPALETPSSRDGCRCRRAESRLGRRRRQAPRRGTAEHAAGARVKAYVCVA